MDISDHQHSVERGRYRVAVYRSVASVYRGLKHDFDTVGELKSTRCFLRSLVDDDDVSLRGELGRGG